MPEHQRDQDGYIPIHVRWVMKFINNIGFPIAVCIYLAYQQVTAGKDTIKALNDFREVVATLNRNIEQQTKLLKHKVSHQDD